MGAAGVLAGAETPADSIPEPTWTDAQRQHWSFVPPGRPPLPRVKAEGWVRNAVDAFVLKPLEDFGLTPAAEADRVTLIRRLRFDLTGLPPTAEEVDAFVADARDGPMSGWSTGCWRVRSMASAGLGSGSTWRGMRERWIQERQDAADVWRYRDWVVQALNDDMPYDRFVALQLAGDEVAPGDRGAFIATASTATGRSRTTTRCRARTGS